jgi:hypothetical protein
MFLEAGLPITTGMADAACEESKYACYLAVPGDGSQPHNFHVGEWHHHRHAGVQEAEQIELLELSTKGTGADVLDGGHPLVGVHHLLTDLEGHSKDPCLYTGAELYYSKLTRYKMIKLTIVNVNQNVNGKTAQNRAFFQLQDEKSV